jgi:hypothetical protein
VWFRGGNWRQCYGRRDKSRLWTGQARWNGLNDRCNNTEVWRYYSKAILYWTLLFAHSRTRACRAHIIVVNDKERNPQPCRGCIHLCYLNCVNMHLIPAGIRKRNNETEITKQK